MIKPSVLIEGFVCKEPERVARSFLSLIAADPIAIAGDGKRGETKAGCGYAGYIAMVLIERRTIHAGAIGNQPGIRITFFPEVLKGTVLEVFKELLVFTSEFGRRTDGLRGGEGDG